MLINLSMKRLSVVLIVSVGLLVGLLTLACSEAPVNPDLLEPVGYRVYFWDEGDIPKYYSYDPVTQVLDSLSLPYRSIGAKVSPDGRQMWTATLDGSAVVMDIAEREVVHSFDVNGYNVIELSANGKYAALMGDKLAIVSVSDFSIVYSDTIVCSGGVFTADGTGFYYLSDGVFRLALDDAFRNVKFNIEAHNPYKVTQLLPNADESSLYLTFKKTWSWDGMLAEYKPGSDSFELLGVLGYTDHDLALVQDERFLIVTTILSSFRGQELPYAFQVYDMETKEVVWEPWVIMEVSPGDSIAVYPSNLVITPDNRWAIMLLHIYSGAFIALDLETMKIDQVYRLGQGHKLQNLSCTGQKY